MSNDIKKVIGTLNKKYKNIKVIDAIDNGDGSMSLSISVPQDNAKKAFSILDSSGVDISSSETIGTVQPKIGARELASVTYRDLLSDSYLDLLKTPDVLSATPQDLYRRSMNYYKAADVYGSLIDVLTNFAVDGFQNDIDDQNIRDFYDNWVVDVEFDEIVEQVFFEFFRSGLVRTYKVVGDYIPKINQVSTLPGQKPKKSKAAEKEPTGSKGLPLMYTILDPRLVVLENALFTAAEKVYIKAEAGKPIKELMEKKGKELSPEQKELLKSLPTKLKSAIEAGKDIPLEPELIGRVDYRKQPYEVYPTPRGARAFTSMEYKKDLRNADSATLDGITNYILLIKVGNDQFPIKDQTVLDTVASLFNTPAKSFNVVWNHTMSIEKIVSPEIDGILGQQKYKQVNEDITGSFGVIRAVIDGVGEYNSRAVEVAVKALEQEVAYARRKVTRWIYREYRSVAEAMGFERYPKVRFDNMSLKNEVLMMSIIQGLIDRRIISYDTGQKMLGLDPKTEVSKLEEEMPLVLEGILGIIGSPYNPKATPQLVKDGDNVQDEQRTPKATPSEGRPKGKPSKKPAPPKKTKKPTGEGEASELLHIKDIMKDMDPDEIKAILGVGLEALQNK